MNKHQSPIGHVNEAKMAKALRDNLQKDINVMQAFEDKCFSEMVKRHSTGEVNTHFDGIMSKIKKQ